MAVCRGPRLLAGAVVSAGWAIGALRASTALDNRAASSLEFVVQGDPSINDGAYSYTCDSYAGGKRLGEIRLSCDRELGAGSHVHAIGRMSRFENDAYGRSRVLRGELRKLRSSGWYRLTRAFRGRCLGCETSSLPLSLPRPIRRARSLPALSADAPQSCVLSRRAICFR